MSTSWKNTFQKYSERHLRRLIAKETQFDCMLLSPNIPGCSQWPDTQNDVYIEKEVTVQYVLHICYDIQNETQTFKLHSQNVFKQNIFLYYLNKQFLIFWRKVIYEIILY